MQSAYIKNIYRSLLVWPIFFSILIFGKNLQAEINECKHKVDYTTNECIKSFDYQDKTKYSKFVELAPDQDYLAIINNSTYGFPNFVRDRVSLFSRHQGRWKPVGYRYLPEKGNYQGMDVLNGEIVVSSHLENYLLVYDIKDFFIPLSKKTNRLPKPRAKLEGLTQVASLNSNKSKNLFATTAYQDGGSVMVYRKNGKFKYKKIIKFDTEQLIGAKNSIPTDLVFITDTLLLIGFDSHSRILEVDISGKKPVVIRTIKTQKFNLFFPVGLAYHHARKELFVSDHMYNNTFIFDIEDKKQVKLKRVFGGKKSGLSHPLESIFYGNTIYTSNILIPGRGLVIHPIDAQGHAEPIYRIPNQAQLAIEGIYNLSIFRLP